jgi:hypothetical protein
LRSSPLGLDIAGCDVWMRFPIGVVFSDKLVIYILGATTKPRASCGT